MSNASIGPVFEPEAGWGVFVGRWLKKYGLSVLLPLAAIIVIAFVLDARFGSESLPPDSSPLQSQNQNIESISVVVRPRDGYALVARRVIAQYLAVAPPPGGATGGGRLYAEERLRARLVVQSIIAGAVVVVPSQTVAELLAEYNSPKLSDLQRQRWESYASRVKFE